MQSFLTLGLPGARWAVALEAPCPPPAHPADARSLISLVSLSLCDLITPACLSLISCLSHLLISSSPLRSSSPHPSPSAQPGGRGSVMVAGTNGGHLGGHTDPVRLRHTQGCAAHAHTPPRLRPGTKTPTELLLCLTCELPGFVCLETWTPPHPQHAGTGTDRRVKPLHTRSHADADGQILHPHWSQCAGPPGRREGQIRAPCTSSSLVPAPISCAPSDRGSLGGTQSSS